MKNYRIVLSYDGTDYFGWQRQPSCRTIQGTVEAALERLAASPGRPLRRRTDGRRRARPGPDGQLQGRLQAGRSRSFSRPSTPSCRPTSGSFRWRGRPGLPRPPQRPLQDLPIPNHHLARPSAPSTFATPCTGPTRSTWPGCAGGRGLFVRQADFQGFSSNRDRTPVRRVTRSEIRRRGDEIVYIVEADGFLRYMVRTIVGTLLEIGRGTSAGRTDRGDLRRHGSARWPPPPPRPRGCA